MLAMPRAPKASPASHRNSISTASAAGSGGGGGVRSTTWSTKDDQTLIEARAKNLNWNQIAPNYFPSKSPNACRKRHERLMEKQNAEQWDGVKLDVLAQAYMDVRREMWSILAERVGEKWTLVEQKCMEKGLRNLTHASRTAQKKQDSEERHERPQEMHDVPPDSAFSFQTTFPSQLPRPSYQEQQQRQQQRIPSIHNMLGSYPGSIGPSGL
ncbi:hypothetical protein BU24DRAFT_30789 [Aaosphaeria arxii CBS 175.79]|uniref:Myb-like domain-containing protein n=1 Tax=Aaosphaeria arxii CBS 175.79 TaxID=1450172 RepID=A0A6A5YAQ8_9PLEO|nr:uncharacterized protein BU24DRAFT_30789 [Aaosphaeria arxii CBS 175.79]KAF2021860.1 hypothetical protein BU24DRAFT_30789 [Aaosphaeria arxii CBS 175.79]